jgi:hypothetical protein
VSSIHYDLIHGKESHFTARQRVERVLRGAKCDRVPFTIYENKIPQSKSERLMRNRGMCIVKRDVNVFNNYFPNINITQEVYWKSGKKFERTVYETPVGELSTLKEAAGFTFWTHEKMFKTPEDYKALLFLIKDECFKSNYQVFAQAEEDCGDDVILRANIGHEPLQSLISGNMMDMQDFCIQWIENRDDILRLYSAIVENRRKIYPIVAKSPASHVNYGGNVIAELIGPETYRKYYVANYNEAAEILHKHGKLIGSHYDSNCKLIANIIAETDLDYIEAFTPAPDTNMTLSEARNIWPNKVLWLNFPSSLHLKTPKEIVEITVSLLDEAKSLEGLLMGITEDMPRDNWQQNCLAIMDGLDGHVQQHPEHYLPF